MECIYHKADFNCRQKGLVNWQLIVICCALKANGTYINTLLPRPYMPLLAQQVQPDAVTTYVSQLHLPDTRNPAAPLWIPKV